jgi:hypothetical protein
VKNKKIVLKSEYFNDFYPKSLEDIICEFNGYKPCYLPFMSDVNNYFKQKPEDVILAIFMFFTRYCNINHNITQWLAFPLTNILLSQKKYSSLTHDAKARTIELCELDHMIFDVYDWIDKLNNIDRQFIMRDTIDDVDNFIIKNKYEITSKIIILCYYFKRMSDDLLCYLLSLKVQYSENEINQILAFSRLNDKFSDIVYHLQYYNCNFTKSNYKYIVSSPHLQTVYPIMRFDTVMLDDDMMELYRFKNKICKDIIFQYFFSNIDASNDKYVVIAFYGHDLRELKLLIENKKLIIKKNDIVAIKRNFGSNDGDLKIKYLTSIVI